MSTKRPRSPSLESDNPQAKRPNTGPRTLIRADFLQHSTHWREAKSIMDTGVLNFFPYKKDDTPAEKKLFGHYLLWLALDAQYPETHELSKGSMFGKGKFTFKNRGCAIDLFVKEFDLRVCDIMIWKWHREYTNERALCYLITTIQHNFEPELERVSLSKFKTDHYDEDKDKMFFMSNAYPDKRYDTLCLAFEKPESGPNVWKINPLTATLSIVNHSLCVKSNCSDMRQTSDDIRKMKTAATAWNQLADDIDITARTQLQSMNSGLSTGQKKFQSSPVLFHRICDILRKSCSLKQKGVKTQATIRYNVTTAPYGEIVTFDIEFRYGYVYLFKYLYTAKDVLQRAIDEILAPKRRVLSNVKAKANSQPITIKTGVAQKFSVPNISADKENIE
jgi:hypothetical protein